VDDRALFSNCFFLFGQIFCCQNLAKRQNLAERQKLAKQNLAKRQNLAESPNLANRQKLTKHQNLAESPNLANRQNLVKIGKATLAGGHEFSSTLPQSRFIFGKLSQNLINLF
jgi:hypothetical protein